MPLTVPPAAPLPCITEPDKLQFGTGAGRPRMNGGARVGHEKFDRHSGTASEATLSLERIAKAVKGARDHLRAHPGAGVSTDSFARATLEQGLRMQVVGPSGQTAQTDMPSGVGGEASAPSPGWLVRAGVAACTTTMIALRAAELGIVLDGLEITVSSRSDDCGMLGIGADIPAGPMTASMQVQVSAQAVDASVLNELVAWGIAHSPMADALQRAVPMEIAVAVG